MMQIVSAIVLVSLLSCVVSVASSTFSIQWNNTRQRIDGFGVSCATRPAAPPQNILDLLFDPNIGIGLNLVRSRVSYDLPNATTEIPFLLAAKRYGVQAWSTPWSPPPAWKSNQNAAYGGYLLPAYYQQYATYLIDYVANTQTKGIQLFGLSIANEPDNSPGYESCTWNATQMHSFVKILATTLRARKLQTRIIMGESSVWDFGQSTLSLDDPATNYLVDIVGTHTYGGSTSPSPFAYAKTLWMTEWCDTVTNTWDPTIASGIRVAVKIHQVLSHSQANAFHYWWTSASQRVVDNQGLLGPLPYYNVTKRLYAMGQFSKFIRPNWVRIAIDPDVIGNMYVSAYRHPTNGSFAIVAINAGTTTATVSFSLVGNNFIGVRSLTPYSTTAGLNIAKGGNVVVGTNQVATLNLAGSSVTTFTGCARPGAVASIPAPSNKNLLANGDYEWGNNTASGWYGTGGTVFTVETAVVRTGRYAAEVNLIHSNPMLNMLQFNLPAGTFFYVSTWVRKEVPLPFHIEMWVVVTINGTTSYYSIDKASDNELTPTWLHMIGGFYIPLGQVTTLIVDLQGPALGQKYYIDSTTVTLAETSGGVSNYPSSTSTKDWGFCPAWTGPTSP